MVSIGTVWDRTTQVLGGRGSALAGIAAIALFAPTVVRAGYTAYVPQTPGAKAIGALIALVALFVTVWGQLGIVALSSDPATTRAEASRVAARRLPPAIGIAFLLGVAVLVLAIPAFVAIGRALTPDSLALMQAGIMPRVSGGASLFAGLYGFVLALVLVAVGARLFVLNAVIVNERRGLGAIARAFRLTHGLTWKLIGLLVLYAIVLLVALGAAQAVVGIVFRLILGADQLATVGFLAAIAGAAVTATLSMVAGVFAAQLYVAARDTASPA